MTQLRFQIRPQAAADLDGHARNIARDNLEAAFSLYDKAEETYEMLGKMPHMGALHQTIKSDLMGIRYAPIKDYPHYLVFYRPIEHGVDIIRILHARMDKDGWI